MPDEKVYVIPLSKAKRAPRYKRANRAVKLVQEFLSRHLKSDEIKIDQTLNQKLWARGARNPPSRIRVMAVKQEDGTFRVFPAE
jgi:large subunit ribosomal protein L31e